jgi:hypothetical protein
VDDGSTEPAPAGLVEGVEGLARVGVLRLRRNLGHQRAIAVGLTHLYVHAAHDAVVVMDGDGEDRASDVPRLLQAAEEAGGTRIVFAQRARRVEGLGFRAGYVAYRALHLLLVGRDIMVGNFSVVPRALLARLVGVSALWNHYAASVYQARLPHVLVPATRAPRLAGQSKMNLVSLVLHGLSAISVHADVVGVRVLQWMTVALALAAAGVVAIVGIRFLTDLAIPGWATSAVGLLVVTALNLTVISMLMALFTLQSRAEASFIPLRDHSYFVLDEVVRFERA